MKGRAAPLRLFASDGGLAGRELSVQGGPPWDRSQKLVADVWDSLQGDAHGSIAILLGITDDDKRCLVLSESQTSTLRQAKRSNYLTSFKLVSPIVVTGKPALKKLLQQPESTKSAEYGFELLRVLSHVAHNPSDWPFYGLRAPPITPITVVALCVRNWVLDTAKQRVGFQITVGTLGLSEHATYSYQNKARAALDSPASEHCQLKYMSEQDGFAKLNELKESPSVLFVALSPSQDMDALLQDAALTGLAPWSDSELSLFHALNRRSREPSSAPRRGYDGRDYSYSNNRAQSSARSAYGSGSQYSNDRPYDRHTRRSRSPSRTTVTRDRSPRRTEVSPFRRPQTQQRSPSPPNANNRHFLLYFNDLYNASCNLLTSSSEGFTAWQPHCYRHYSDGLFHEFCDMLSGPTFIQRQDQLGQAYRTRALCQTAPVETPAPRPPLDDDEEDLEPIDPQTLAGQSAQVPRAQDPYDDNDDDDNDIYYPSSRPVGGYSANLLENEARRE